MKTLIMDPPLVTVALSVFNLESSVEEAVQSVFQQSYPHWELIAIDDASTDRTFDVLERYEGPKVRVFRNPVNRGTYWNRNMALLWARGEFFTTIDGDDEFYPDKLKVQLEKLGDRDACLCHCIREHPRYPTGKRIYISHNTLLFRRSLVEEIGYYDTVRYGADTEYIRRISLNRAILRIPDVLLKYRVRENSLTEQSHSGMAPGSNGAETRTKYEQNYHAWYQQTQHPYQSFPSIGRSFDVGCSSQAITRDSITASLASFPEREESLRQTIDSLMPWADRINVFLNEYQQAPAWLDQPKIHIRVGEEDIGDRGKFWWADSTRGYHFICDDDILYSQAYAQLLLAKIEYYQREAIVGVHSSWINYLFNNDSNLEKDRLNTFHDDKPEDVELDFLGAEAIAYHTDHVHLSLDLFPENNMADIFLALHAKKEGIPLICCESPDGLIKDVPLEQDNSIHSHSLQNTPSKLNLLDRVKEILTAQWPEVDDYQSHLVYGNTAING